MALRGVECSVHFIPIPLHPYYRNRYTDPAGYAEAFRQYPRLVSLPLYPGMTDEGRGACRAIGWRRDCHLSGAAGSL